MSTKVKFVLVLQVANVFAFLYWFGKDEFADIFFITVTVSCVFLSLICVLLFFLYDYKKKELMNTNRLHAELTSTNDYEKIKNILLNEIGKRDAKVEFFERKGYVLTTATSEINLFDPTSSAIAQAFFNLETIHHERGVFVPIAFEPDGGRPRTCWELHGCMSKECPCHGKSLCECWKKSGYMYKGTKLLFWQDKLKKCLCCPSFLPLGVFRLECKKLSRVLKFISEHAGMISTSYMRQKTYDHLRQENDYYMTHDPLVKGLLNRRGLFEILRRSYEAASHLCLCMISVDRSELSEDYLLVNELYGELGSLLVRGSKSNIIARYGLADFTVVFPDTNIKAASDYCEALRKKIAEHTFCLNKKITVSIGIVDIEEATDPEALIEKACVTLESAKLISNSVISSGVKNSSVGIQNDYLAF